MLNIELEISDLVAELVNRIRRTGIIIFPEAVIDRPFGDRRNDFGLAEFCGDPDEVIKQGPDKALLKLHFLNIQKAEITCFEFKIRKDILKQTEKEGLFNYPKIENIRVKCAPEIAYCLYEQCKAKKLVIMPQEDGSLIVVLPPSTEADAFRWILGEGAMSRCWNLNGCGKKSAYRRKKRRKSTIAELELRDSVFFV